VEHWLQMRAKTARELGGQAGRMHIIESAYWMRAEYPGTFPAVAQKLRDMVRQYSA
jgi:hypothetical protein